MKKSILLLISIATLASCGQTNITSDNNGSIDSQGSTSDSSIQENVFVDEEKAENRIDDNYRNFYEIFVPSYADSNGDHVGDLNGITAKLPEIASIGYTGIWLSPIFKSNTYHKYDASDYFTIDPSFGTMDDLKTLVSTAHSLGIKIILDGVFNHSGENNEWFSTAMIAHRKELQDETLTDEEKNYASLYVFYDTEEDAKKSGSTYYKAGGNNFYYEANFSSNMPEFNFDSEFTYTKIQSIIDFYMADDIGVDGFRLDAVKYYKLGNTEENVKILSRISKMIKDNNPDGYAVGECWSTNYDITQYYQSDLDSYFWFPASTNGGFITSSFSNEGRLKGLYYRGAQGMEESAGSHIPAPFIDNHDMGRVAFGNNASKTKFNLGLLGMLTGNTFTYYGDEIGMNSSNLSDGDYKDSSYRTHYYWDDETHEMECDDVEHALTQKSNYPAFNQQKEDENSILNYVKKVNHLRNTYPFIARGKTLDMNEKEEEMIDTPSVNLLAFRKEYEGKESMIVINFSATNSEEYIVEDGYEPKAVLLADVEKKATYKDNVLTLPSYSIAILEK